MSAKNNETSGGGEGGVIELLLRDLRAEDLGQEEVTLLERLDALGALSPALVEDMIIEEGLRLAGLAVPLESAAAVLPRAPAIRPPQARPGLTIAAATARSLYEEMQVEEAIARGATELSVTRDGRVFPLFRLRGPVVQPCCPEGFTVVMERAGREPEVIQPSGGTFLPLEALRRMSVSIDGATGQIRLTETR